MRFIFKILIGMIIFNAFLFVFSTQFKTTPLGEDITGENVTSTADYDVDSSGFAWTAIVGKSLAVSLILLTFTGLLTIATKNVVWFGAGALMSFIYTLYSIGTSSISDMFNTAGWDFAVHIWDIFTFIFMILCVLVIVEMFTGRSMDD